MEKGLIGVSDVSRKIKKGYICINNEWHKIIKGYLGVNNVSERVLLDLPDAYQEVEYLETTTAGPYIRTNIAPGTYDGNYAIEIKELHTTLPSNAYIIASGSSKDYPRANIRIDSDGATTRFYTNSLSGGTVGLFGTISLNAYNTIYVSSDQTNNIMTLKIGDTVKTSTQEYISTGTTKWSIFSMGTGNKFVGRICYTKFWGNGQLVGYFIPCYRKSDNVAGMYDIVGDAFYTNQGTGSFSVGGDV